MISTLDEFVTEFEKIKALGWVKTHRSGPTGIGKTLEDLLGIPENNRDEPDFGDYELKASRKDSQSMLTLFTRAPEPSKSNEYLRKKYGYISEEYDFEKQVLHSTLSIDKWTPVADTGHKLKVECVNDRIHIVSELGTENVYWSHDKLDKVVKKKFKNKLVYVKALSRGSGSNEEFKFVEAFVTDGLDPDKIFELICSGDIYVDLRIGQYEDGRTHDHGTGFRIRECDQDKLFKNKKRIA
jgi:hypothetical protein